MSYGGLKAKANANGKREIRQTARIIEILFSDPAISDEDREIIQQWLISDDNQAVKTEMLGRKFQREFKYDNDPVYALKMWPELSERLKLNVDVDKVLLKMKKPAVEKREAKRSKHYLHTQIILRVAAVLLPVFMIGAALYISGTGRAKQPKADFRAELMTVSVPCDKLKTVMLPDSSKVWLRNGSTIEYSRDFRENRLVKLDGEAYFSVKYSDGAVFTVETDKITVTVLGTEFNMKSYSADNEAQITLDEGSVEVTAALEKVRMEPRDRITLDKRTNRLKIEKNVSTQTYGRAGVEFYDNTLKEMFTDIAIYFNMELEINGNLPEYGIRFRFDHDESLDTILSVLKNAYKSFSYEITKDKISITAD